MSGAAGGGGGLGATRADVDEDVLWESVHATAAWAFEDRELTFTLDGARRRLDGVADRLTHLDEHGAAHMVDVGAKPETARRAVARAVVRMTQQTAQAVLAGDAPKGDVLGTARLAGIQAAKRTGELIPLCHPIGLDACDVEAEVDADRGTVTLTATTSVTARTGVEMEAMTAAAIGALTVYDMVKGLERGVVVERVELLAKDGGRSGSWRASGA